MDQANALPTPMVSNLSLSSKQRSHIHIPQEHRSIIGALQYVTITRPDIAFSVSKMSQFMHFTLDTHFMEVKRIIRYFKGSMTYGMTLNALSSVSSRFLRIRVVVWMIEGCDRALYILGM